MYELKKINKRLYVCKDGLEVYTPPDFLRITARHIFNTLLDDLNRGMVFIEAVMKFETKYNRRK